MVISYYTDYPRGPYATIALGMAFHQIPSGLRQPRTTFRGPGFYTALMSTKSPKISGEWLAQVRYRQSPEVENEFPGLRLTREWFTETPSEKPGRSAKPSTHADNGPKPKGKGAVIAMITSSGPGPDRPTVMQGGLDLMRKAKEDLTYG